MRIAVLKPDHHIIGGFELVVDRIVRELRERGHTVDHLALDVPNLTHRAFDVPVPDEVWRALPEYFAHMAMTEAFSSIDLRRYDAAITTQPPSYAIHHPRILSIFYHHLRMYYDLSELYIEAGFVPRELHTRAGAQLRRVDADRLARVTYFLAASQTVKARLADYNALGENVGLFSAGLGIECGSAAAAEPPGDIPLCVSRSEFPKRTELFVQAMKLLPDMRGVLIGGGARLDYVRNVDAALSTGVLDAETVDARSLWCTNGLHRYAVIGEVRSNVAFRGHVTDVELQRAYADCTCVVAPAYMEDYGLTALEAMAHGRPVVVCKDGGGLVELVEDRGTGLVVDPTPAAIARAVRELHQDRAAAQAMGERGREVVALSTWERAMEQIDEGLERVMAA